ncbi:MAG: energy transducer TonB [bacterium]|nr:energy transducer TonB [bacterium]
MRLVGVCLALGVGYSTFADARRPEVSPRLVGLQILDLIGDERIECPAEFERYGLASRGLCSATSAVNPKAFNKQLRSYVRPVAHEPGAIRRLGPWMRTGDVRVQKLLVGDHLRLLVFDAAGGVLAYLPPHPCLAVDGVVDLHRIGDEGLVPPRALDKPSPSYPRQAAQVRASGLVVVQALITPEGNVVDACVAHVNPAGLGFEESALQAIRNRRFVPGMIDDIPVATLFGWTVEWSVSTPGP